VGIAALLGFIAAEWHTAEPMLPLGLLSAGR
jgi:hypothetical protein